MTDNTSKLENECVTSIIISYYEIYQKFCLLPPRASVTAIKDILESKAKALVLQVPIKMLDTNFQLSP